MLGSRHRLLPFALINNLEDLLTSLRYYALIFSAPGEYEVCANIAYLQGRVQSEISRKSAGNKGSLFVVRDSLFVARDRDKPVEVMKEEPIERVA